MLKELTCDVRYHPFTLGQDTVFNGSILVELLRETLRSRGSSDDLVQWHGAPAEMLVTLVQDRQVSFSVCLMRKICVKRFD